MRVRILNQDGQYTPGRESRWQEGNELILKTIKEADNKQKEIRVLDIGCGEGVSYKFLKERAQELGISLDSLKYYAVDNNPELVPLMKGTGITFQLGDFTQLGDLYEDRFFDVILASEVIEHVVDTDSFILSLKKILKDTGSIFITTPNLASWHGRLLLLFGFQPLSTEVSTIRAEFGKGNIAKKIYHGKAIMHVRAFTVRALVDFIKFHGFVIEKLWGGGYREIDNVLFTKLLIGLSPVIKVIIKKDL